VIFTGGNERGCFNITQFESLNTYEEQDIAGLFLRVDEVMNTISGLDENMEESIIVKKLLRSLQFSFNAEVSFIEEMKDM